MTNERHFEDHIRLASLKMLTGCKKQDENKKKTPQDI